MPPSDLTPPPLSLLRRRTPAAARTLTLRPQAVFNFGKKDAAPAANKEKSKQSAKDLEKVDQLIGVFEQVRIVSRRGSGVARRGEVDGSLSSGVSDVS